MSAVKPGAQRRPKRSSGRDLTREADGLPQGAVTRNVLSREEVSPGRWRVVTRRRTVRGIYSTSVSMLIVPVVAIPLMTLLLQGPASIAADVFGSSAHSAWWAPSAAIVVFAFLSWFVLSLAGARWPLAAALVLGLASSAGLAYTGPSGPWWSTVVGPPLVALLWASAFGVRFVHYERIQQAPEVKATGETGSDLTPEANEVTDVTAAADLSVLDLVELHSGSDDDADATVDGTEADTSGDGRRRR